LAGEPERAVQIANRALNARRDSPVTWFLLGESYSDLGRLELAVKAYREAIQLEEQYPVAWLGLGKAYARLGRTAELKQVTQALEKLDPAMARELAALPAAPK
jgi:cytochrome c-type biogenesis protein CcmH/NrfG